MGISLGHALSRSSICLVPLLLAQLPKNDSAQGAARSIPALIESNSRRGAQQQQQQQAAATERPLDTGHVCCKLGEPVSQVLHSPLQALAKCRDKN